MKRFYCTICKKVKRVRNYPTLIEFSPEVPPTNPVNRFGECNFHSRQTQAAQYSRQRQLTRTR